MRLTKDNLSDLMYRNRLTPDLFRLIAHYGSDFFFFYSTINLVAGFWLLINTFSQKRTGQKKMTKKSTVILSKPFLYIMCVIENRQPWALEPVKMAEPRIVINCYGWSVTGAKEESWPPNTSSSLLSFPPTASTASEAADGIFIITATLSSSQPSFHSRSPSAAPDGN